MSEPYTDEYVWGLQEEIARLTAEVERLTEQLHLANVDAFQNEAEANGMRPVVDAALTWYDADESCDADNVLGAAVESYRALDGKPCPRCHGTGFLERPSPESGPGVICPQCGLDGR